MVQVREQVTNLPCHKPQLFTCVAFGQVVAVLTSDWTVLCLNHHLKLMWKVKVTGETKESFYIRFVPEVRGDLLLSLLLCQRAHCPSDHCEYPQGRLWVRDRWREGH